MIVGQVKELWRYPVKSMAGQRLQEAEIYWYGVVGDRQYALVHSDNHSHFPWLTARELPSLVLHQAHSNAAGHPGRNDVRVTTPENVTFDIGDPKLRQSLSMAVGRETHLMHLNRNTSDAGGISLLSTATGRGLTHTFGKEIDLRRFRQNIIIDAVEDKPYVEDQWISQLLVFGNRPDSAQLWLLRPIQRCVMINVDPDTAERDPRVLKGINATRDNCFGVYAIPRKVGTIRVGDPIHLVSITIPAAQE